MMKKKEWELSACINDESVVIQASKYKTSLMIAVENLKQ